MPSRKLFPLALLALGALGLRGAAAHADVIELVGGRALQGRVLEGQTTEDGLAVEVFDTGGVVVVKWDHILPTRAKELRLRTGLDAPEEQEILVDAHRVLLTTGQVLEGKALNPDEKDRALQLKTRTSVQSIERPNIARIDEAKLPGMTIYTPMELYNMRRDENPPATAAAHREMALFAMRLGGPALDKAREHLDAAKADAAFAETPDGRNLPTLERQLDVLIRSKGAQDLVAQIQAASYANRWNDALRLLNQLDDEFKEEQVRDLIKFPLLEGRVVRGRDTYFRKEIVRRMDQALGRMIEAKAREKKPLRDPTDLPRGASLPGTLSAARQWLTRELPKALQDKVTADLELKDQAEFERFWKERSSKGASKTASYGTGSFVVIKKEKPKTAGGAGGQDPNRNRRPPGSNQSSGGPQQRQTKEDKPKTEEEWWEQVGSQDRARWMTAYFVEHCGVYEVVRTDESELCGPCGGRGVNTANNTDGTVSQTICPACNGAAKVKKVVYK